MTRLLVSVLLGMTLFCVVGCGAPNEPPVAGDPPPLSTDELAREQQISKESRKP